ncbi:MAG TPA: hypothetical protein VG605_17400, partial [Puia sp.]|nr:hypothetical protein [Puia sp.]
MKLPVLSTGLLLITLNVVFATPRADTARFRALLRTSESWVQRNIDSCESLALEARGVAVADHDRHEEADAIAELAVFYRLKAEYATATQYYQQARGIYDSVRDWCAEASCLVQLAQLYKDIAGIKQTNKLLDQGVQYALAAYKVYDRERDTVGMMVALNEMGIIYRDKGKVPKDAFFYDTAYT